jgi:alpha-N-arabinofuranosidase
MACNIAQRHYVMIKFILFIFLLPTCMITTLAQQHENTVNTITFSNPVIPGFNPDPSVCRVGDDYYLVTSTFEYFPGVPVYHSKDLIHWEHIGYCLTRKSQLPLDGCRSSGGIYAPTIRYYKGKFYMVTTNVTAGGNFYVYTDNPAGEWSEPVWVKQGGIDPTLFFDEDGKIYLTSNEYAEGKVGIALSEIDIETGQLLTPVRHIWGGTGGRYPEAPHIYKMNGWYYLMIAEGGTEYGHMETIARSRSIWGPYEPDPGNPILTHRGVIGQNSQIQGTGHADLIEAHDGSWWMVFLAFRKTGGDYHHLGRETFLAPVSWNDAGWPVVNGNGTVSAGMKTHTLPLMPVPAKNGRDEFDQPVPDLCWNFLRNPDPDSWSLTKEPGTLVLYGLPATLDEAASPAFIGRRQQHFNCTATAEIDFHPEKENEMAGITVLMNERHHYDLNIQREGQDRYVILGYRIGNIRHIAAKSKVPQGRIQLQIKAEPEWYTFGYMPADEHEFVSLGRMETRYLSSEVAGGFTGVYLGMFATGNGQQCETPAWFRWFEYKGHH